jgi:hypothetical protein
VASAVADVLPYVAAGAFGGLVGTVELITRYRDDPRSAVLSAAAGTYILVNVIASVGALYVLHVFDLRFGFRITQTEQTRTVQVLVAGIGSAILFRSAVLSVVVGDQLVNLGPSAILAILTSAADRAVDRRRARIRCKSVAKYMANASFEKAAAALPAVCWGAMQNATRQEIDAVENIINGLKSAANTDVPDQVKSYILGFALLDVVGESVLQEIAEALRGEISTAVGEDLP